MMTRRNNVCMYSFICHSDHKNVITYSYTSFVKSCIDKNNNVGDLEDITAYSDGRDSLRQPVMRESDDNIDHKNMVTT